MYLRVCTCVLLRRARVCFVCFDLLRHHHLSRCPHAQTAQSQSSNQWDLPRTDQWDLPRTIAWFKSEWIATMFALWLQFCASPSPRWCLFGELCCCCCRHICQAHNGPGRERHWRGGSNTPPCRWPCSALLPLQCLPIKVLGLALDIHVDGQTPNCNYCSWCVVLLANYVHKPPPLHATNPLFQWRCRCTFFILFLHCLSVDICFGPARLECKIKVP